uniref:Prefoldin subunit 4 n=2 Tax=Hirondellea gigas TaxID=1518452 RepID=A0A2P2I051_9CRUS
MASLGNVQSDSEEHITYDDQQKINKFACCNTRLDDIKKDLETKETELNNLGDAEDEIMIALDTDEKVPFLVGEVFVYKTQESATEALAKEKEIITVEIARLKLKAAEFESSMGQLKADLYAKFGNNINLEAEED